MKVSNRIGISSSSRNSVISIHKSHNTETKILTKGNLKWVLHGLQASDEEEARPPPHSLKINLLRHQRTGLYWMLKREGLAKCIPDLINPRGGILADDQGLGKTITAISLFVSTHRPLDYAIHLLRYSPARLKQLRQLDMTSKVPESIMHRGVLHISSDITDSFGTREVKSRSLLGGTLVLCPTAVLHQWEQEFRSKVNPKRGQDIYIYHGCTRLQEISILAKYEVVITTYQIIARESPDGLFGGDISKHMVTESDTSVDHSRPFQDYNRREHANYSSSAPLSLITWHRVVLDEAQSIKNNKTQIFQAVCSLQAVNRWCLTGTPIQNSIYDMLSYFQYLRFEPYCHHDVFVGLLEETNDSPTPNSFCTWHGIMKNILLRRTKLTSLHCDKLLKLPPRKLEITRLQLRGTEFLFHNRLAQQTTHALTEITTSSSRLKHEKSLANILYLVLQMRLACCHPWLVAWGGTQIQTEILTARRKSTSSCQHVRKTSELHYRPRTSTTVRNQNSDFMFENGERSHLSLKKSQSNMSQKKPFFEPSIKISYLIKVLKNLCHNNADSLVSRERSSEGFSSDVMNSEHSLYVPVIRKLESSSVISTGVNDVAKSTSEIKQQNISKVNKVIIFSQWTSLLDVVEIPLRRADISFVRLDGNMDLKARDKAVRDFLEVPGIQVMIMSLKAAGMGLNLTVANHVILLDLWWNPCMEEQAIDRAHRIGQKRGITVHRFTICDSIEDKIFRLQDYKMDIVRRAFGRKQALPKQSTSMTFRNLCNLLDS